MNIIWSDKAEEDFEQNIIYLLENWNEKIVQKFTYETEFVLNIISKSPKVFQKLKKINVHFDQLQNTLRYFMKSKIKMFIC